MKKIVHIILGGIIFVVLIAMLNELLVEKAENRYYILSKELEGEEEYDVQIYGSCHAYTSYDPRILGKEYGISAYNMSNSGEIMPATYLRMVERFKKDLPEVAVVEIWGINPYETYDPTEDIFNSYFRINVENIPFSIEKIKVINDFESLNLLEENLAILKYKNRLLNFTLSEIDFRYSFERVCELYNSEDENQMLNEMENRIANNGFKANPDYGAAEYEQIQNTVSDDEILEVEADIMKYVDKIIELCNQYDVELVFYRAPYVSTKNELRKVNYLKQYLNDSDVAFYDLEKEIAYDCLTDFADCYHLSETGAKKSTEYLNSIILKKLK